MVSSLDPFWGPPTSYLNFCEEFAMVSMAWFNSAKSPRLLSAPFPISDSSESASVPLDTI
ncbi:unnamed protein product [Penicillium manginii]